MKTKLRSLLCSALAAVMTVSLAVPASAAGSGSSTSMKVGVSKVDITGPIIDISTGYNSLGDLMQGLNTRLYARAFVVDSGSTPMVYVSAEMVHMTESIKPGVLKLLKSHGYTCFTEENVMLSATHCHSSSSNVAWVSLYNLMNGIPGYDDENYALIVKGIAESIEKAYDSRVNGTVSLVYDEDPGIAAYNRSADAYLTNIGVPDMTGLEAAQNAYNHEMSGIILTDSNGQDLGFLNFFASHGTSNPITNRLIASDHKGYASLKVEEEMGNGFVAAFAQADSGDVSPNAVQESDYHAAFQRPADVDASLDPIENQIIYGAQEAEAALDLINGADRTTLTGSFDFNYSAVDFSDITVDLDYVGEYYMPYDDLSAGYVETSEPCIGAAIIAGDEEGAPVDNAIEGTVKHNWVLNEETQTYDRIPCDFTQMDLSGLENILGGVWPLAMKILNSDGYDEAQMEKAVCLAVGNLMQKTQPLQILRMGELAIVGVPFELTYEQANRIKAVLEDTLDDAGISKIIISTHSNAYSQYVTTREEYAAQHYEGSTCLFGPWSGAALTQELDKLAQGLVTGNKSTVRDPMLQSAPKDIIPTYYSIVDPVADVGKYGTIITDVDKKSYSEGEWVRATFSGVSPRHMTMLRLADNSLANNYTYLEVQKKEGTKWVTVLTDTDPYTTFHCVKAKDTDLFYTVTVGWLLKGDNWESGTYRLVYNGITRLPLLNKYKSFSKASSQFTVTR